ncbi:hypothetical protein BDB01DRAFT_800440 [Pilobolus umbonatus]|nr:hypothetical protein BDB01DRAFT_800440 [Pilobolus umbonatus]
MSENTMVTPLFHQRSHSMPVGHVFHKDANHSDNNNHYVLKRVSPLKAEISPCSSPNDDYPLLTTKHHASHFQIGLDDKDTEFFHPPKILHNLYLHNKNTPCSFDLKCNLDKGFFMSQSHWTCYRRNYFQVSAAFTIQDYTSQVYALRLNSDELVPIQHFFVKIKACTSPYFSTQKAMSDDVLSSSSPLTNNKSMSIALTQMTPKRDKGPQREPPIELIHPTDGDSSADKITVSFERLQFKVATANNGKRRATQQYFQLVVELIAESEGGKRTVLCECSSAPLVVRGRSPGHYGSEYSHNQRETGRRKKRMNPYVDNCLPMYPHKDRPITLNSMDVNHTHFSGDIMESNPGISTLPPPLYVFSPPRIGEEHHSSDSQTLRESSSSSYQSSHFAPISYPSSAFTQFHNRSQSANDPKFMARHQRPNYKYHHPLVDITHNKQPPHHGPMYDSYEVNFTRALSNWQNEVSRQRTDSGTTYDSYNDSQQHSPNGPNTPISYHQAPMFQSPSMYPPSE